MNEREVLIYHYSSKNQKWYDATKNIVWYMDDGTSWKVRFAGRDEYFHVAFSKMRVYDHPKTIEFAELYFRGSPCFKVKQLLCFNEQIYKIFYESGYTCLAKPNELKIVKDVLADGGQASGVMAYYRRVVQETVQTEEDQFLLREFDDINYVNEESVLALYLKGQLAKSNPPTGHPTIFPFGVNLSQMKALKMMFENRISIIEGPPGTGKTQTILSFIANALINGKTIAVVSNNNSATDNVFEKLEKNGYSFMAAPLGNADNVERFFESYHPEVPSFQSKPVDIRAIENIGHLLPQYFSIENKKKKAIERLTAIELEYKHFLSDNPGIYLPSAQLRPDKVKPGNVAKVMVEWRESGKKLSLWRRFIIWLKLKLGKSFFRLNPDEIDLQLHHLYYLTKIRECKEEIADLERRLNHQTLDAKVTRLTELSKAYFEKQLSSMFGERKREGYAKDNYKRQFKDFVKDYPVILSSTYSLAKCSQRGFLFDYLIVDESSQVNMASAILSMRMARNMVVVGDIKQLPQIDDDSFAARNEQLLAEFKVPKTYSYYGNSIMSSLLSLYGDAIPKTMLREHYRCHPDIISFCNERFYNGELIIYTKPRTDGYSMKVIKTVPGNFARKNPEGTGIYNQREIDEIKELLSKENLEDVGIISPYRYQTQIITEQVPDGIEASTIHKFQGREKKTIIFSSAVNDSNEFVENDNLINVAVSRAVDRFILVTSDKVANSRSGVLSDLVNYIQYRTSFGRAEEGAIRSIYDLLYGDYQNQLASFRARHPSVDLDSENLTRVMLKQILSEPKYRSYAYRMHVSLRDFIDENGLSLTDEERKFFRNRYTHADFLVYNKMSKKPVLVIEVDGVAFHEQKAVQRERDAKKDSILNKAGIKLLRLKTNQSGEKDRVKEALDSL